MAENKNRIIVYRDWISTFDALTDEEAGKLIKHFFRYINDQNPEAPDRLIKLLFEPIKQTLKRDLKAYESICEQNRENVAIRWNKKDTTVYDHIRPDTKHTDSDIDNDIDSDIDSDKKRYKDKTKYADFVSMTEDEYKKLIELHGDKNTRILIEILDNYKGANGKKYKNDYRAILNWVIDRAKQSGRYEKKPVMP